MQVHMYMEPQTAIAKWDEGGVIQVSCTDIYPMMRQGCAMCMASGGAAYRPPSRSHL